MGQFSVEKPALTGQFSVEINTNAPDPQIRNREIEAGGLSFRTADFKKEMRLCFISRITQANTTSARNVQVVPDS